MKLLLLLLPIYLLALTPSQISIAKKCYEYGKPYDLGNTLAGICMVESSLGEHVIGSTNDYGITQINIYSHLNRLGIRPTSTMISKYATILVRDDNYALAAAVAELQYWQLDRERTNWAHLVNSYHNGSHINNPNYATKVTKAIRYLKKNGIIK